MILDYIKFGGNDCDNLNKIKIFFPLLFLSILYKKMSSPSLPSKKFLCQIRANFEMSPFGIKFGHIYPEFVLIMVQLFVPNGLILLLAYIWYKPGIKLFTGQATYTSKLLDFKNLPEPKNANICETEYSGN